MNFSLDEAGGQMGWSLRQDYTTNLELITPFVSTKPNPVGGEYTWADHTNIWVTVHLYEPTGVIDTGTLQVPWEASTGLGAQAQALAQQQGGVQGGFTDTDRASLQTVEQNTTTMDSNWSQYESVTLPSLQDMLNNIIGGITTTITGVGGAVSKTLGDLFSQRTLDLLTEYDIGTACAPDVIDGFLTNQVLFGLNATCTSYADWYVKTGPGDSYITESLGTLEVFRGGTSVLRLGLHTTTHMVYPMPGMEPWMDTLELPEVPGDYEVRLTPAPETCWHLAGLKFP